MVPSCSDRAADVEMFWRHAFTRASFGPEVTKRFMTRRPSTACAELKISITD
jgi:hypothetical protein